MKTIDRLAGGLFLLAVACSPQVYYMNVEERNPSKSGLDLAGKNLSVVYDEASADTAFNHAFAESFASLLEEEYFGGERAVGVYSADFRTGNYASRDSMVSLVMQTDADVVFVVENPTVGTVARTGNKLLVPVTMSMSAYDALGGEKDNVRSFNGSTSVSGEAPSTDYRPVLVSSAPRLAKMAVKSFMSTWKEENIPVYYYDSAASTWMDATSYAAQFKWKEAMQEWMKLLDTRNMERRSCAEYDIATACYMLGDYELAAKWLDRSDADCPLTHSKTLREKIKAKTK